MLYNIKYSNIIIALSREYNYKGERKGGWGIQPEVTISWVKPHLIVPSISNTNLPASLWGQQLVDHLTRVLGWARTPPSPAPFALVQLMSCRDFFLRGQALLLEPTPGNLFSCPPCLTPLNPPPGPKHAFGHGTQLSLVQDHSCGKQHM